MLKKTTWLIVTSVIILILVLLTGCTSTEVKYTRPARGDFEAAFDYLGEYIEAQMKKSKVVGLSVAVVDDKEVLWTQGFGYADKAKGIAVTPGTLFDPASVTKVFTATALMQLVEQGKVDLNRSVSYYLPEFSMKSRFSSSSDDITVRQLLTHHSGIPGDRFKGMLSKNPEAFVKYKNRFLRLPETMQDEYMAHTPDYTWGYSNVGYALLGCIIDRVGGRSYFEYMKANVLNRVNMSMSTFDLDAEVIGRMTRGYEKGEEVPFLFENTIPAGSLAVSAEELALFLISYLSTEDTRLLRSETKQQMFTRQNAQVPRDIDFGQGLGWMIADLGFNNLGRVVFHDGGEWSANAKVMLLLDENIGFTILTNSAEGSALKDKIAREIIRVVFETKTGRRAEEYRDLPRQEIQIPVQELKKLEGIYIYPSLGAVQMNERKGKLFGIAGKMKMKFIPYDNGRFGLKPLLLGFIPVKIGFFEGIEISFNQIEGDMISPVYDWGSALPEIGLRVEKPQITELWQARQGTYEVINAEDDFPILSPWDLELRESFLFLAGNIFGSKNMRLSIPILPVDESYALTGSGSIGRRSGETIFFEEKTGETYFRYSGYVYRKVK